MPNINKIPIDISNAEIEKGETLLSNDGRLFKSLGSPHSQNGTPVILSEGSRIFSKKLKADKDIVKNLIGKDKVMSFSEMTKNYDTHEELKALMDNKADTLEKKTAELMLTKKLATLDSIFDAQETSKELNSKKSLDTLLNSIPDTFANGGMKKKKNFFKGDNLNSSTYQRGGLYNNMPLTYGNLGTSPYLNPYTRLQTQPILVPGTKEQLFPNSNMVKKNLFNKKLYNNIDVGDYQKQMIGWDNGYKTDPLSIATRRETVNHLFDDNALANWKHIDVKDQNGNFIIQGGKRLVDKVPEGDFTFSERKNAMGKVEPSIIDYDNVRYQKPMFRQTSDSYFDATPNPNNNTQPLAPIVPTLQPLKITPKLPEIPLTNKPGTPVNNPTKPNDDLLKDVYKMNAFRDIADLATLDINPPAYNYEPQNIAYTRFLPQNTLGAERQFNIQREQIQNSDMPEQYKASLLGDLYGKFQDSVSDVQNRNYQGDLQNDNQNVNLFNNITNQNRQEQTQYNDRNAELNDRLLSNLSTEKSRIKDNIQNDFGKWRQYQLTKNLVNQLGENYTFNGSEIQYIPGKGNRNLTDPLAQYSNDNLREAMLKILNNPNATDKDKIDAVEALTGKKR